MADKKDLEHEKKSREEILELLRESEESQRKSAESVQETIDRLNNEKIVLEQIAEARSDLFDAQERTNLSLKHRLDSAKALLKLDLEGLEVGSELYRNKMREYDLKVKSLELEEKSVEKARALAGLVVSNQWKNSTWGLLQSPEGWKGMAAGIKDTITPMNIFGSSVMKMQEQTVLLAGAQDDAIASMNKMTSAAPGLEDKLIALEHDFQSYGVSADEAGQAIGTLFTETSDFSKMSDSTQKELAETTAVLNELGVEMGTTAQITQTMTKVFGKSGEESAATSRELFSFAQSIGMNAEEVSKNFAQAAPEMAAFGDKSVDTFKKLQASAKSSGIEVSRMLSIVEKFDTFDGAAESVGQLNAILGGPFLSSLDMVTTTDPTERMKMLSEAVNESGQSFDDMSYYQRKALAEAMGLESAAELALVMRDGFDATVPAVEQSQEALAAQADQTRQFQTMQEELNQTMRAFAVSMRPAVEIFKWFLNLIQKFNRLIPGGIGLITLFAAVFYSLYKVMLMVNAVGKAATWLFNLPGQIATATTALWAKVTATWAQVTALASWVSGLFAKTTATTAATAADAASTAALGAQATATGVAAAADAGKTAALTTQTAATGASTLADAGKTAALTTQTPVIGANSAALSVQTTATKAGSKAAGKAVPMMLAFGAAMLMIGGGVFLAAAGVALLVLAFSQLNSEQLVYATVALIGFGIAVGIMMAVLIGLVFGPQAAVTYMAIGVMLAIAAAAFLIGAAVGMAAAGIALLVGSFALLFHVADPVTMLAFTAAFAGFVAVLYMMLPLAFFLPLLVLILGAMASAFVGMAFAMSKMDFSNFEPLAEFFKGLASLVSDTEGGILKVAEAMAMMTDEINKLDADKAIKYTAVMTGTAMAAQSPAFAGNASSAMPSATQPRPQPIEIVVKLKEKVLGKTVGTIVDNKFKQDS